MIERVHHIDFVVRDLDAAIDHWTRLLGRLPRARETLEGRGVELARFDVGGIWIILVQAVDPASPVQEFLERHGEGFFHLAFAVEDVEAEVSRLARDGFTGALPELRSGVMGWRLVDIPAERNLGAMVQLTEEPKDDG